MPSSQLLERAEQIVALATTFDDILKLVTTNKVALKAIEDVASEEARREFKKAMEEFAHHVSLVIANNPLKSFSEIMGRADVQQALVVSVASARERAMHTIKASHVAGYQLGRKHAKQEAAMYGLKVGDAPLMKHTSYLGHLESDLQKMSDQAVGRMYQAAQGGFGLPKIGDDAANNLKQLAEDRSAAVRKAADREGRKLASSASASTSMAVNKAYSQAQVAVSEATMAENPGTAYVKVWVTNFGANTCPDCASLHGTTVGHAEEFDHDQSFGTAKSVYQELYTPPRHPNCHCRIVLVPAGKLDGTVNPAKMRQDARDYAESADSMAPKSWGKGEVSAVAKTTPHMASSDIRRLSDSQYDSSIRAFRACVLGTPDELP